MMKDFLKMTAMAAGAVFALSGGASASPCGIGLDTTYVQITSVGGNSVPTIDASDCAGPIAGNDTGNTGTLLSNLNGGLFASVSADLGSDWTIFGKSDETTAVTAPEAQSGAWSVNFSPAAYSVFAVSLKAANDYNVYLFDLRPDANSLFGGDFETTGILNNGGRQPNLSHMTIAVWNGETPPPAPVPLPAAGWMLLAGVGGLAAWGRRRKNAA